MRTGAPGADDAPLGCSHAPDGGEGVPRVGGRTTDDAVATTAIRTANGRDSMVHLDAIDEVQDPIKPQLVHIMKQSGTRPNSSRT